MLRFLVVMLTVPDRDPANFWGHKHWKTRMFRFTNVFPVFPYDNVFREEARALLTRLLPYMLELSGPKTLYQICSSHGIRNREIPANRTIYKLNRNSWYSTLEYCAGSSFGTRTRPEKFTLTRNRPDPQVCNPRLLDPHPPAGRVGSGCNTLFNTIYRVKHKDRSCFASKNLLL